MINFREYLIIKEEFRGEKLTGIFKNPTADEIKLLRPDVRAIAVTKSGNLFVANTNKGYISLHWDILGNSEELYGKNIPKITSVHWAAHGPDKIITLQRIGNTDTFAIGESEPVDEFLDLYKTELKAILKKIKKKNPTLKFLARNILTTGPRHSSN